MPIDVEAQWRDIQLKFSNGYGKHNVLFVCYPLHCGNCSINWLVSEFAFKTAQRVVMLDSHSVRENIYLFSESNVCSLTLWFFCYKKLVKLQTYSSWSRWMDTNKELLPTALLLLTDKQLIILKACTFYTYLILFSKQILDWKGWKGYMINKLAKLAMLFNTADYRVPKILQ